MKIGEPFFVAVKSDGSVIGNGAESVYGYSYEQVEENLTSEILKPLLEDVNDCKIEDITIKQVVLIEDSTSPKLAELTKRARSGDNEAAKELIRELAKGNTD